MSSLTKQLNQVQKTIVDQLSALNPLWRYGFGVRTIVIIDDLTLRLCCRLGSLKVNIDIHYNEGTDYYEVKAYKLKNYGLDVLTVLDEKDLGWEQLLDVLNRALKNAQHR